jgi:CheY-like chemotaxis protein
MTAPGAPIAVVVGDDPEARGLAIAVIDEAEMNTREAANVDDALAFFSDHAPDVRMVFVLLQSAAPLDGFDLARVALWRWPWIKVLIACGTAVRDIPRNVVLLPRRWRAADIRAHMEWEAARARASDVPHAHLAAWSASS